MRKIDAPAEYISTDCWNRGNHPEHYTALQKKGNCYVLSCNSDKSLNTHKKLSPHHDREIAEDEKNDSSVRKDIEM